MSFGNTLVGFVLSYQILCPYFYMGVAVREASFVRILAGTGVVGLWKEYDTIDADTAISGSMNCISQQDIFDKSFDDVTCQTPNDMWAPYEDGCKSFTMYPIASSQ